MKKTKVSKLDYSGQTIYNGLDIHHKNWKVAIYTQEYEHKVFSQDPSPSGLWEYLHTHFPGAKYQSVYEAGFSGFWIHKALCDLGIENIVINPADLPSGEKDRLRKGDKRDARSLARSLRAGNLEGIYCPSRSCMELRGFVRRRSNLVVNQTRCKNRIKAHLKLYGITIPANWEGRHWSGKFLHWLSDLEFATPYGKETVADLLSELKHLRGLISAKNKRLRQLSEEDEHKETLKYLLSVPGVGMTSAWVIYSELIDIDRFDNLDRLHSYCGLVPDCYDTGEKKRNLGITRRANRHIRSIIVECAWHAIRKDPYLQLKFVGYKKKMSPQRAIIRIAKKLVSRIRFVWINQTEYQINHG